ncbi:Transcriptional repressor tup11-related protein [Histomonas meleagridis]|uniref:Transcriptional repressor tup11-related protein n=1 Tax=Histomonas meleagridis TaxID=135588 RepID=UPI00355A0B1F|nr:Transcriptional repressor tup11-related protein [Histomonas meleagridis]KAH0801473.1 Transcriptional repressor tup11-related protein [Histomonas meleagridis]
MSILTESQLKEILDQLCNQYETLCIIKEDIEEDIQTLEDTIHTRIQDMQKLANDFINLKEEIIKRKSKVYQEENKTYKDIKIQEIIQREKNFKELWSDEEGLPSENLESDTLPIPTEFSQDEDIPLSNALASPENLESDALPIPSEFSQDEDIPLSNALASPENQESDTLPIPSEFSQDEDILSPSAPVSQESDTLPIPSEFSQDEDIPLSNALASPENQESDTLPIPSEFSQDEDILSPSAPVSQESDTLPIPSEFSQDEDTLSPNASASSESQESDTLPISSEFSQDEYTLSSSGSSSSETQESDTLSISSEFSQDEYTLSSSASASSETQESDTLSISSEFSQDEYSLSPSALASPESPKQLQYSMFESDGNAPNSDNEEGLDNWEIETLVPPQSIHSPLKISLFAEISEVSIISGLSFSPDSRYLTICSETCIRLYDIDEDKLILRYVLENDYHVTSIAWANDSKRFLCSIEENHIFVFNGPESVLIQDINTGFDKIYQVKIAPNQAYFASATNNGITVYSLQNYSETNMLIKKDGDIPMESLCLSISPDSNLIVVSYGDSSIAIWNVNDNEIISQINCQNAIIHSMFFIPNSSRLVTASLDPEINVWEIGKNSKNDLEIKQVKTFNGHKDVVLCLDVSADGRWLLSGSKDTTAILTDLEMGEMVYCIKSHTNSVLTVEISKNLQMFVTGGGDNQIKMWEFINL